MGGAKKKKSLGLKKSWWVRGYSYQFKPRGEAGVLCNPSEPGCAAVLLDGLDSVEHLQHLLDDERPQTLKPLDGLSYKLQHVGRRCLVGVTQELHQLCGERVIARRYSGTAHFLSFSCTGRMG